MKKIGLIFGVIFIVCACFIMGQYVKKGSPRTSFTVAIMQTASHPALDAVRKGFIELLKEKLGNELTYTVYNAQGSVSQAHALAQQLHADRSITAFFAIATPAAQALSVIEKKRPIIIAAVTDPEALGFVYPGTNICGVSDMVNIPRQADVLTQLVPSAHTVGLLYTSGETNSVHAAQKMRSEFESRGLRVIDFAASSDLDIQAITTTACRKADALFAPTDNTVASTITLLAKITRTHKKPFFVSDNLLVPQGPLASCGIDYYTSGKQAADMALQVLHAHKKPSDLSIEYTQSNTIVVNEITCTLLGLPIPRSLVPDIVLVKDN